jgi:hypothetical protein
MKFSNDIGIYLIHTFYQVEQVARKHHEIAVMTHKKRMYHRDEVYMNL